jgi:hypothetical protein
MSRIIVATTLLGSALLILAALFATPAELSPEVAASGSVQVTGVRVEWARRTPNAVDDIDTRIRFVNRSATHAITLGPIVFLGPKGAASPLAVHTGLDNRRIGPLETIALPVDGKIAGLVARQTRIPGGKDVTNAVVAWNGPAEALHVTALIRYTSDKNYQYTDFTACVIAEGFPLSFGDE